MQTNGVFRVPRKLVAAFAKAQAMVAHRTTRNSSWAATVALLAIWLISPSTGFADDTLCGDLCPFQTFTYGGVGAGERLLPITGLGTNFFAVGAHRHLSRGAVLIFNTSGLQSTVTNSTSIDNGGFGAAVAALDASR